MPLPNARDLTDAQWNSLDLLIPPAPRRRTPASYGKQMTTSQYIAQLVGRDGESPCVLGTHQSRPILSEVETSSAVSLSIYFMGGFR
jgi:hypothetical protein